jgi:RND family efflux transporter MFP subunit
MKKRKSLIISLVVLLGAALVVVLIFLTEPTAQRESTAKETAMLVEVTTVSRGTYQPLFVTTGTVKPAREIVLSSRVSGEVIERTARFNPGETVPEGTDLLKIDPSDYINALQLRKSELRRAEANLSIEEGRQEVARQDYQQSNQTLDADSEALVLRQPQLNTAQAELDAARASVEQATLDLERTTVKAPFDVHILSRQVDAGTQVAPGQELARLVGTEEYWVETTVPQSRIKWLAFPDDDDNGADVRVHNSAAWEEEEYRAGQLYQMIGAINDQTRLVRVLVSVTDPLHEKEEPGARLPLMIGAFVETGMVGRQVSNVVKLSRDYVRKGSTVWVMKDGALNIMEVDILLSDAEHAYISEGLSDGDSVVTTNLATVVEGSPLRVAENGSD